MTTGKGTADEADNRLVISGVDARQAGLKRYFTGIPCVKGHIAERYTSDWKCVVCTADRRVRWAAEDPARPRKTHKAWRDKNVEHVRAYNLSRYYQNPQKWNARARAWEARNPEKANRTNRAGASRRRARMRNAEGSFSAQDIEALYAQQGGLCLCGVSLALGNDIDHKTPISRGGSNWPDNLQLLCPPCNARKYNKTMDEWLGGQTS